uniref:Pentatricopeptide repeat-containing protein n=1 Tax=Ananas comosus var. bracteatus TaxID=296719 RepID=A0A6V7P5K7_ANACO|nr:unnamed protein product [Ananas comosus var. bracteatus]
MLFPRRYSTYYFPTTYSPNYSRTYPAHPQPLSLLLLLHLHGPLPSPRHVPAILARALRLGAHDDALVAARLIGRLPPRLAARALAVLPGTSLLPFNAAIRVLSESPNLSHRALALFKSLKLRSLSPNDFTFSFLLKAASASKDASFVRQGSGDHVRPGDRPLREPPGGVCSAAPHHSSQIAASHGTSDLDLLSRPASSAAASSPSSSAAAQKPGAGGLSCLFSSTSAAAPGAPWPPSSFGAGCGDERSDELGCSYSYSSHAPSSSFQVPRP